MSEKRERFSTVIPVSNDGDRTEGVGVNFPKPLTEGEWEQLLTILNVMKAGLVEPAPTETETPNG